MPCALQAQGISYRVTVAAGAPRAFRVRAEFPVPAGRETFEVALPVWSPGSYEIMNYARYVHGFRAAASDGRPLAWNKADQDTWRIESRGVSRVVVEFLTDPDSVALELSRIGPDFAFFNGTNLFPYPVGAGFDFPAEVELEVPAGWRIATGLTPTGGGGPGRYRAASYHDLVDSPTFLGRFALDSVTVDGHTVRFAMYPESALTPAVWDSVADALRRIATTQHRIMGGPPYDDYTVLVYAPATDLEWAGGLEHRNSQFDVVAQDFFAPDRRRGVLGDFTRPLLSHEFFHLWNVKRLRPAAMWPYDYAHAQPTPLLWWSEGVTDYYGDLTLARGGLWTVDQFVASMDADVQQVEDAAESVSAEDASTDTWIKPTWVDEAQYYYPKGALLGLMLDIRIREATAGRHSLDDVMRALLDGYWRRGRGFDTANLLDAIRPWYPGVDDFYGRFVRGREALPYDSVLPRAAISVERSEERVPRLGVGTEKAEDGGAAVTEVEPGSLADEAGVEPGDVLLKVGEVSTTTPAWPLLFRTRYAGADGRQIQLVYRHAGRQVVRAGTVHVRVVRSVKLEPDAQASPAARSLLQAIAGSRP